jgi:hypothetical protein
MGNMKRIISMLVAFAMLIGVVPTTTVHAEIPIEGTPVVGILQQGMSRTFVIDNSFWNGALFGMGGDLQITIARSQFFYITLTDPNGYSYTNYDSVNGHRLEGVIEGIPPEEAVANPVPAHDMQVIALNFPDSTSHLRGLQVINPIHGDNPWLYTVTYQSGPFAAMDFVSVIQQPIYFTIGDDVYGCVWRFNTTSGVLTARANCNCLSGERSWRRAGGESQLGFHKDVTSIVYGDDVTRLISSSSPSDFINLTSVTFKSAIPPEGSSGLFDNTPALTTIYVPVGSKATYQEAWGGFFNNYNIVEVEFCLDCGESFFCQCNFPDFITIRDMVICTNELLLDLSGLNLTDDEIKPLAYMRRLDTIDLSDNLISDLEPLRRLRSLAFLLLNNNPVKNLEPLSELKNLAFLSLWNVTICRGQVTKLEEALPNAFIWAENLIDCSASCACYVCTDKCVCADCECDCDCKTCHDSRCVECNPPDYIYISAVNVTEGYIELTNPTDTAISTRGLFLSNDEDDLFMWQMPVVIISPDDVVQIRTDSNDKEGLKRMRTNFDLEDEDMVWITDVRGNTKNE